MPDPVSLVRNVALALGLSIPEERLPAIAHAIETALRQVETIRHGSTPVPDPTPFDAGWSAKP